MSVPEASVDEDSLTSFGEGKVWRSRKSFHVDMKAVTERVECTPRGHFRFGALLPDAAHYARTHRIDIDIHVLSSSWL